MLSEINAKLIALGNALLSKIKYGLSYNYSQYEFFKLRHEKKVLFENKLRQSIYRKLP